MALPLTGYGGCQGPAPQAPLIIGQLKKTAEKTVGQSCRFQAYDSAKGDGIFDPGLPNKVPFLRSNWKGLAHYSSEPLFLAHRGLVC
jgi:hypothetical protein